MSIKECVQRTRFWEEYIKFNPASVAAGQLIYYYFWVSRRQHIFLSRCIFISKNTLERRHLDSLLRSLFFWCRCLMQMLSADENIFSMPPIMNLSASVVKEHIPEMKWKAQQQLELMHWCVYVIFSPKSKNKQRAREYITQAGGLTKYI